MRSTIAVASLVSLAGLVAAQSTYGRFPCTIVNGDGTFSADPSQCSADNLVNPGQNEAGTGVQGDGPTPVNPECVMELESGAYACGIAGATCTSDSGCDNGLCVGGQCQGGFTQTCGSNDENCLGFLYCLNQDFATTASDTCGGLGAFCQDFNAAIPGGDENNDRNYAIFNQYCASGYCGFNTGVCSEHTTTVGGSCAEDPDYACTQTSTGQALTCDQTTFTCQVAAVPSGRARARRNLSARSLCSASGEEACAIEGGKGFECIDTSSNLEQCGGCASVAGVDCTAIEGVEQVGCVQGTCEIWSCADGYTFDSEVQACTAI
ncbi:hypothetical protein JCM5353_000963 [Sporobolomyces roseus]